MAGNELVEVVDPIENSEEGLTEDTSIESELEGKIKIYAIINPSTRRCDGYGSTSSGVNNEIEIVIDKNHDFLISPFSYVITEENEVVLDKVHLLEQEKKLKDIELNNSCNESILSGFDLELEGVNYHFSYDGEAQTNYLGAFALFEANMIETEEFTAFVDGKYKRIEIDHAKIREIVKAGKDHTSGNIRRYRTVLLPLLEKANTLEEVAAIHWDMEVGEGLT